MRILHISSARISYPGGTEKIILELTKRQAKKHKVTVLQTNLYEEDKPFIVKEYKDNIKIITCQNDFFLKGLGYSKKFKQVLKKIYKNYDIIHIHGHGRFTSVYSMKFLSGKKPFIYSAQGFFHSKKHGFFKKAYDILFKKTLQQANFCTALTKLEEKTLLDFGVSKDRIKVIPGGVDIKKFKKTKIKKDNKTLLYVGGITDSKGLQYVIRAIKDLDLRLLIAGTDRGYKEKLERQVNYLQLQNKVKFLGKVSDKELLSLYQTSDALILFSEWEGFGLVAIEAMASGTPVIASNRGALPYIIKENKNGILVNYPNVKELKYNIKKFFKDKKKRSLMSKESIKFSQKFDWGNIVKQHLDLYLRAIKQNERGY